MFLICSKPRCCKTETRSAHLKLAGVGLVVRRSSVFECLVMKDIANWVESVTGFQLPCFFDYPIYNIPFSKNAHPASPNWVSPSKCLLSLSTGFSPVDGLKVGEFAQ